MTTRKYTRNQSRLSFLTALDNEFTRAAVNLVIAADEGKHDGGDYVQELVTGFRMVFGGEDPKTIFGSQLGFVKPRGMPPAYGFTPADIVSAYVELERRKLGKNRGSLQRAQCLATEAFIDIGDGDAPRQVRRDWANGKNTVQELTDDELCSLIAPYEVTK